MSNRLRKASALLAILFLAFVLAPKEVQACTCTKLMGKYNKLQNKYTAAVMAGNPIKMMNYRNRIANLVKHNWKEIPGCPPPVIPASWCPDPGGGGGGGNQAAVPGGRGHGAGVIGIPGDTANLLLFLRNADPGAGKTVKVRIKADSTNPAGIFNLLDTFKTVVLPPLGTPGGSICTVDVEIIPLALVGQQAFFDVTVEESDGKFWNETITGIVGVSDIRVTPLAPFVEVPTSGTFTPGWRVSNPNPAPVLRPYTTFMIPDSEGLATRNDGSNFPIFNSYPLDKTAGSGTISLPGALVEGAADPFVDILCDMVSNELCEPTMLGCKGIELDGLMATVAMPNDATGLFDPPITSEGRDLTGLPAGGFLQVTVFDGPFPIPAQVPTFPGQPIEEILDQLAIEVFNLYLNQNNYAFQAVAVDNFFDIFGPPGRIIQFESFDPGLNWQEPQCEHPGWQHAQLLPGDEVRLSWLELNPPAAEYDVIVTPLGTGSPTVTTVPGGTTELIVSGLALGQYHWQIQAVCDPFVPLFSPPSAPDSFQLNPCNNGEPPVNLNSVVGGAAVSLSWDVIDNTVGCQVRGTRLVPPGPTGNANVLGIEVGSTTVGTGFLGAGTTWEWMVRCACNIGPLNPTPFSTTNTFSVPSPRLAEGIAAMKVYPNPASNSLQLEFEAAADRDAEISMVDLLGRLVHHQIAAVSEGQNNFSIDVSGLADGLYLLRIGEGELQRIEIMH